MTDFITISVAEAIELRDTLQRYIGMFPTHRQKGVAPTQRQRDHIALENEAKRILVALRGKL